MSCRKGRPLLQPRLPNWLPGTRGARLDPSYRQISLLATSVMWKWRCGNEFNLKVFIFGAISGAALPAIGSCQIRHFEPLLDTSLHVVLSFWTAGTALLFPIDRPAS
jgi:hypothetical protein